MGKIKIQPERTVTLADAVSDAFACWEWLGSEFREMCDNAPDSLQATSLYETRDGTASTLECLSEPDVSTELGILEFKWQGWTSARKGRGLSRADQSAEACAMLEKVIEILDDIVGQEPTHALHDDAEALRGELDGAKSEVEGCEFPGMYG